MFSNIYLEWLLVYELRDALSHGLENPSGGTISQI